MIGLSKSPARLLYFYFCLNTKISSKFIEFEIEHLLDGLFLRSSNKKCSYNVLPKRRSTIRKSCVYLHDHQHLFSDFSFSLSYGTKSRMLRTILVKRSKIY